MTHQHFASLVAEILPVDIAYVIDVGVTKYTLLGTASRSSCTPLLDHELVVDGLLDAHASSRAWLVGVSGT
jgi:hypothetical protein